jgi:CheY-like chemotaxis protein
MGSVTLMLTQPVRPILIVEDNTLTRTAVSSLLNMVGYVTTACRSAEEALVHLEAGHHPSLIILDIRLDGLMDGIAFRQVLLQDARFARIPVVVYSAADWPRIPRVVAQLRKTADPEVFLATVARACRRGPGDGGAPAPPDGDGRPPR